MSSYKSKQLPDWLTHECVQNILTVSENDSSIIVHSVTGKIATANGDNFMSDILRVSVEFTRDKLHRKVTEKKSLIFKVALNKDSFSGTLTVDFGVFETEIDMLQNTLIKMKEALNEKHVRFNANVFFTKIGDPSFLVLEDLRDLGFRMVERKVRFNLQHCMLVMQRLAKFHASSVAVYEKDPDLACRYSRGIYYKDGPENMRNICKCGIKSLAIEVAKWTDLDPCYSEKLYKLSEVCYEKGIEYVTPKEGDFNVINHGDCWINNLLFRYDDEGAVVDQIFVDFQVPVWSSPALDLLYFLSTSADDDVFDHHYDALLDEYLNTLTSTMSSIGCSTKPPTPESFRKCLQEREFFVVMFSIMCLRFMTVDETVVTDLRNLLKPESGQIHGCYKGQHFRERMKRRLKEWNSRGLLDV